jgi:hypothetical protein
MKETLTEYAVSEIKAIHALSREYNAREGRDHNKVLLELVKKHIGELQEEFDRKSGHFVTEAGDLAVLCFEMMLEAGKPMDEVMELCYSRYRGKLEGLLKLNRSI